MNLAAFLWQLSVQGELEAQIGTEMAYQARLHGVDPAQYLYFLWLRDHGLVPALITESPFTHWDSVIMGIFLHGGWMHLLGNLWFLYIFGDNVEDRLGTSRYVLFYVLCGVAASFTQVAADTASQIPIIGASGAIAGVLGAYLVLFPKARVVTVIPIFIFLHVVRLPAFVFLVIWLVYQNILPVSQAAADGVAYWAHIGGFVAGAGYLFMQRPRYILPERREETAYRSFDNDGYW